jgi:hypothetical protein
VASTGIPGVVVRSLVLGATLSIFSGCPPEECHDPGGEIALVAVDADPTFGVFEGPLVWLQTADQSNFRITITRDAESATRPPCAVAQIDVTYDLQSSDGSVAVLRTTLVDVTSDGLTVGDTRFLTIDASALIEAGKLPDAPGIESRKPVATLTLEQTLEGLSATVSVTSDTDQLTAALGMLVRLP